MSLVRALLLLLGCCFLAVARHPEIRFEAGKRLDEGPDRLGHPGRLTSLDITLTPARVLVSSGETGGGGKAGGGICSNHLLAHGRRRPPGAREGGCIAWHPPAQLLHSPAMPHCSTPPRRLAACHPVPLPLPPTTAAARPVPMPPPPLQGAVNHPQLMADFVAPVYRDDATGRVSLRGPTMRVRQGEVLTINLRNNLTRPAAPSTAGLNGFSHVADTNMHIHGMHSYPGAWGGRWMPALQSDWLRCAVGRRCRRGRAAPAASHPRGSRSPRVRQPPCRAGVTHQTAGVLELKNYVDNDNIL